MDALEAIETRRSVRKFLPEKIEEEKLSKIIEAGRCAPSGGGNRTSRFFVIEDISILDDLSKIALAEFSKMEYDENTYKSLRGAIMSAKQGKNNFHYNAPVLIIFVNKKDYGNAMADCVCAIENMMIAANALKIGSCYINQLHWLSDNEELRKYTAKLGINDDETICCSLVLGYPADGNQSQRGIQGGNEVVYIK